MTDELQILPVVREEISLSTRQVVSGKVRVSTQTESVDQTLSLDLSSTEVEVVRVPIDRRIDTMPEVVTEGDLTIVPVVEERLVVTRELYLLEEVHIRHVHRQETRDVPVTTRHQTVHIDHVPLTQAPDPSSIAKDDDNDL